MCTLEKRGNVFVLTLTSEPDPQNRLNPNLISTLRSHLSTMKSQSVPGSVLITRSNGKFFSNGFDLLYAQTVASKSPSTTSPSSELLKMVNLFRGVVSDLLSLPMPTVAAVTGHAAAAGFLLAISHDYVVMNGSKGVLYMSELDLGMTLPDYFTAMIRAKVGSSSARRDLMLGGMKVRAEMAVKMGIIDSSHGSAEECVEAAMRRAEEMGKKKWNGEVYKAIRKSLYPEVCGILGLKDEVVLPSKL